MRPALLCFALVATAYAQEVDSNMSCVERLQMPVYPALARAARISGRVTATVVVASDSPLQTKAVGNKLLTEAVGKAISASVFLKICGGKSVHLIFNFGFDSDPGRRASFGYPNQFWISVAPQVIETNP